MVSLLGLSRIARDLSRITRGGKQSVRVNEEPGKHYPFVLKESRENTNNFAGNLRLKMKVNGWSSSTK